MTNGEKIQQDFKCEVCEPIIEDNIIHVIFADKLHSAIGFDWDWWNLEYKEPTVKNDVGVDCISRAQVQTEIEMNASRYTIAKERGGMGQVEWSDQLIKVSDAVDIIRHLSSVTPQEPRWIPVSEKLPDDRDWNLGIFKESDTRWINPLPFICDYVGYKTKATTKDFWILRGFTDRIEYDEYYYNLECVAWMPLPEPYKTESEDK